MQPGRSSYAWKPGRKPNDLPPGCKPYTLQLGRTLPARGSQALHPMLRGRPQTPRRPRAPRRASASSALEVLERLLLLRGQRKLVRHGRQRRVVVKVAAVVRGCDARPTIRTLALRQEPYPRPRDGSRTGRRPPLSSKSLTGSGQADDSTTMNICLEPHASFSSFIWARTWRAAAAGRRPPRPSQRRGTSRAP